MADTISGPIPSPGISVAGIFRGIGIVAGGSALARKSDLTRGAKPPRADRRERREPTGREPRANENTEPELKPAARLSILRWTFAAALLFVLVLSMWPMPDPPTLSTGWDKTDHIATYFLLGCLGLVAWRQRSGRVLAGLVAYGGAIELLQSLVPSRVGDWQDVMANVAGVLLAAAAIGWSNARRTRSLGAERYRTTNG